MLGKCAMSDCHQSTGARRSILHTLRVRYTLDMIYTYSGNILIAVRAALENLYTALHCLHGRQISHMLHIVPMRPWDKCPFHATAVRQLRAHGLPSAHMQHPSHHRAVSSHDMRSAAPRAGKPAQAPAAPVRRADDDAISRRAARRAEPARVRHRGAGAAWRAQTRHVPARVQHLMLRACCTTAPFPRIASFMQA